MGPLGAGLDLFTPAGRAAVALVALRVTGLVWTVPVLSALTIPSSIRAAVVVLLVALLAPVAASGAAASGAAPVLDARTVAGELVVGIALGVGAAVFVAAAELAGDVLSVQMGLSGASVVDPFSRTQLPVLGQFLGMFVTVLFLAVGGHLAVLAVLAASLEVAPPGAPLDLSRGSSVAVRLGGTLFLLGARFAAPVVAAMTVSNVALGILSRTVPQLNVLMVAFPVQIGVGLVALGASLPLVAGAFAGWGETFARLAEGLLAGLAGGV